MVLLKTRCRRKASIDSSMSSSMSSTSTADTITDFIPDRKHEGVKLTKAEESTDLFMHCPPSLRGELFRKSRLTGRWKSRGDHYELRGSVLLVFPGGLTKSASLFNQRSSPSWKAYDLAGAEEAVPIDVRPTDYAFQFSVCAPEQKTFTLKAPTEEQRSLWISALNNARRAFTSKDFALLKVIGEGHFGKVFLARREDAEGDKMLALKEVKLTSDMKLIHALKERVVLAQLPEHPFIITLRLSFRAGNYIYYGFDFMPGSDLFEFVRKTKLKVSGEQAAIYSAQITLALEHLHQHNIVYRDLKPENVLVDQEGYLKLADLGLSKRLPNSGRTYSLCGTRAYFAPEMMRRSLPGGGGSDLSGKLGYGVSVDFWQLGCFIYELFYGRSPFMEPRAARPTVEHGRVFTAEFLRPKRMGDEAWDICCRLLRPDPEERLGCGETSWDDVKAHPFFECINWDDIMTKNFEPPVKPEDPGPYHVANFSKNYTNQIVRWGAVEDALNLERTSLLFKKELVGFNYISKGLLEREPCKLD